MINTAIRKQVEIEVYIGCSVRLQSMLTHSYSNQEEELRLTVMKISQQPQSYFGIPLKHISPSSWEAVISNLKELRSKSLPYDRIDCLLNVAKDIPRIFNEEHPNDDKPLGADDILPIFIYVLVKAHIPNLLALNHELQCLCDPERRMSESGYYLATLEASLQHIREAKVDSTIINDYLDTSNNNAFSDHGIS
jgi:hypothetical protein